MNKWDKYRVYMHYYITCIAVNLEFKCNMYIMEFDEFTSETRKDDHLYVKRDYPKKLDEWVWKFGKEIFK